jgi:hypothetical protein
MTFHGLPPRFSMSRGVRIRVDAIGTDQLAFGVLYADVTVERF